MGSVCCVCRVGVALVPAPPLVSELGRQHTANVAQGEGAEGEFQNPKAASFGPSQAGPAFRHIGFIWPIAPAKVAGGRLGMCRCVSNRSEHVSVQHRPLLSCPSCSFSRAGVPVYFRCNSGVFGVCSRAASGVS